MFNTERLITNCSKSQRFWRLISSRSLHQNVHASSKTFVYDNLLRKISCRILSTHVQPNLHFSTSTSLNISIGAMAENNKKSLDIDYNDILKAQRDDSILIIDVREKGEIDETGKLPASIHIPMGEVANTLLSLSDKDFKDKFDKTKPSKETKIILSCRSGKRSGIVQEEIQKLGYKNVYNYVGGWLDWECNQKV